MLHRSRVVCSSRYTPVVGCAFLVEALYGSKYSANLGTFHMPYAYVKTILLCATGHGLELREGRYVHGLIELLLPSKVSQDNLTKLELLQFVDAIPMDRHHSSSSSSGAQHNTRVGDEDEEEEDEPDDDLEEAARALLAHRDGAAFASSSAGGARSSEARDPYDPASFRDEESAEAELLRRHAAAAALAQREAEAAEEDAAAVESIMSFVSATAFPSSIARVLVYDAVCTCVADGLYSAKEKKRVALVSSHIGLSSAVRSQIEKLALQEKVISIRKRRLLLLHRPRTRHTATAAEAATTPLREERQRQATPAMERSGRGAAAAEPPSGLRHGDRGSAPRGSSGWHGAPTGVRVSRDGAAEQAAVEAARKLLRRARARPPAPSQPPAAAAPQHAGT